MNEPPGVRQRVGLTGVTMAEFFRDEGRDVLLFIDNIFRFTQAGSEVSALLGRLPSAVGYQPTLANEMGQLQERITSTKRGSITSLQAIYVPADDYTDPAPATTFAHLDATITLERAITERGIYPAVDPLGSVSARSCRRASSARSTTTPPARCSACCRSTRTCRTSSPSSASTSCSDEDKLTVQRARRIERFFSQPFYVAEVVHGPRGQVRLASPTRCAASRSSSKASGTTCPSRRSCTSARSRRRRRRPNRSSAPRFSRLGVGPRFVHEPR